MTLLAVLLGVCAAMLAMPPAAETRIRSLVGVQSGRERQRLQSWVRGHVSHRGVGRAGRRRQARERSRVIQALGTLAAEVEAGLPPDEALVRAAGSPSVWPRAARHARGGGDVPAALLEDAVDQPVLAQLSACWRIASRGSGLADAVRQLAATARSSEDVRVEMEGQLAGPRATARLLSLLPLVGMGLGMMLGSDPLGWLLSTGPGRLCLMAGVALTALGAWWTSRIAVAVERLL
jgi:tight adherence protein B